MAECTGGRTTRGTRSQFRLGMAGLGQCKGFYPIHFGNIMESQSSHTGVLSSKDLCSETKGTCTRAVREYEQTINELRKENVDLKIKLYLCEEAMKNTFKDVQSPESKNPVEVTVKLQSETESLHNELRYKEELLQDAMQKAEKYETDFKELEKNYTELQFQLSSLSELPSKEEYLSLLDEKENLVKHIESLEQALTEKEEEIHSANQKIEILADQNRILEEKIKKRSLAIQSFVYKNYKEKEMLPDELKDIVISATQAAKKRSKGDLAVAVKSIVSTLNEMMASVKALDESNVIESPQAKCLKEEVIEKSSSFLPTQNVSSEQLNQIQGLKEVLAERNMPGTKSFSSLNSSAFEPYVRGKSLHESAVNVAERDTIDYLNLSTVPSVEAENLISFSSRHSPQSCSVGEHNLINSEIVSTPPISSDFIHKKGQVSESDITSFLNRSSEESHQLRDVLKGTPLKEIKEDAHKASKQYSVYSQTDIAGCNLLDEYEKARLEKDAKLSDNVEELRNDVFQLLLAMNDKNKELTNVKQSLLDVQADLNKALNSTNMIDKDYYMQERNELHNRLALSCSVNEELLKHLKILEKFMEDILQNKFNSSIESLSEMSDLLSNLSKCLNKSLSLSHVLSDNLSICEGSKLFEECESFSYKNGSFYDGKSLPHLGLSQLNMQEQDSSSYLRTQKFLERHQSWLQLHPPVKESEILYQIENVVHKNIGYPSSESDIWSEPDRDISMQRIGISLQNSPVSTKSPRKLRLKEKRLSSRLSSEQDTSSFESQRLSKRRHGSASRRLFSKESAKIEDITSGKFYFLLAEKYSKLKELYDELSNIKDQEKISVEMWNALNKIMDYYERALQKLHAAKESVKNFPSAICGKCAILELYASLVTVYKGTDFYIGDTSEQEILEEFLREIHSIKGACKESFPFSILPDIVDKSSQVTQSDCLSEEAHNKVNELENEIVGLNDKNKELSKNLDELKRLFCKDKNVLESVKAENLKLSNQVKDLKEELSDMKQKERDLSLRNEELTGELTNVCRNNSELNHALKELEDKRKESSVALDQLTAELQRNKSDLVDMNRRCLEYENELNQQICKKEEFEDKLKTLEFTSSSEKEKYLSLIKDLNAEKNSYVEELKCVQEEKLDLEKRNLNLQEVKEALNADCIELKTELKNAREHVANLQEKCCSYENEMSEKFKENEEKYRQQLKQLEAKSLSEKQKLINEICVLTREREDIIQKLKTEKECYENLMKEKAELNENYIQSCKQITSLKLLNEELNSRQLNLIQKNEFFAKALQSSNSECDNLNQDLKQLRETLQNLESKCLEYEKELVAAAGMKDTFVECLLKINNEFSSQRLKLNKMCKVYGNENSYSKDESSEFIPIIDEDNVQKLCENLSSESTKLLQSVDILLGVLKSIHLKTQTIDEKHKTSVKAVAEFHKDEIEHLKSHNRHLQRVVDELQKSISEKEKSLQFSAYEIQSLKEKIHNTEIEIEKGYQLLRKKDDEITMLQDRIFNLQTHLSSIMADKSDLNGRVSSSDKKPKGAAEDSVSPDNQLPSQPCLKVSKMCQTSQHEDSCQSADDTFSSTGTLDTSRNSCCDRYRKKCYSLQTKLSLRKKHIEILEQETKDLRESILRQLQTRKDSSEKIDTDSTKLAELESKLEQKKAFINELKGELLKTCNSLIDKQKELDDLKQKLFDYEKKSKAAISDMQDGHSILTSAVDSNVQTLKNYKWSLIQTIFDIQKKFYEKKGIHLNYIEKFKNHVNNIYLLQLKRSFSKSESMPLLGSYAEKLQYDQNDKLKNLVGLELDIECLENLKIFLDRFFVPCVLQTSHTDDKSTEFEEKKEISFDRLSQTVTEKSEGSIHQETDILNSSFPDIFSFKVSSDHKDLSQEKSFSFENFASNVSHQLDCMQNFFTAIKKCQWLEDFDASSEDKAELKLWLVKIFQEMRILSESADKLFELNSFLKNADSFVAASSNRPDVSDRESLMSEETIAVSRSESPLSFEDAFPIKHTSPEMLKLEGKTLKPESLGIRPRVVEPYSVKVAAIGSSCDSVCQRSYYSSPDLGIESDPNHDSSAPEQKDDGVNKFQRHSLEEQKLLLKTQQKSAFTSTESAGRWSGHKFGENLYAIVNLPHYELLRKEVKESLVAIKSVLSRTGDGLHLIGKYTSPRKTLEYNTMKSIKDSCVHIEVCLKAASELVEKFWTAPCPSEEEWKFLNDENQHLCEQLAHLKAIIQKQESDFEKAMGKLEHAQVVKADIEKKISKKLVKTKKVIRQAELKLLENRCQNFPPLPKCPSDQTEQSPQANLVQQT